MNVILFLIPKISVNELIGIKGALICNRPKRQNRVPMWEIKFAKKESIKLLSWIYYKPSLPCLKRKFTISKYLMETTLSETRREYTRIESNV